MKSYRVSKDLLVAFGFLVSSVLTACSSGETKELQPEIPVAQESGADDASTPPLAVATVASLITVNDLMVREPERFKKALCSDGNIYDLDFSDGRFSLRAEPLGVCVLFADTKTLRPSGFCGDARCEATMVEECGEADKKELVSGFAKDQTLQRCWNVGNFPPLVFSVLMTRVGQSCQSQTLVKTAKGWRPMTSIDGTFETRKSESGDSQGCWFESASTQIFEGDWFGREKRVVPVMAFQKDGGSYALLKSSWGGSENFQLFRLDGEKLQEIESFAEAFKDAPPETPFIPAPVVKDEPAPKKGGKAGAKKSAKPEAPAPVEAAESAPAEADVPPAETPAESSAKEEETTETGVNPLEGEQ